MLIVAIRALILYVLLAVVIRLMGKRQIGEMQPFELVVTIVIANLAVIPMSNIGIPLISGVISILVLLVCHRLIALMTLHSTRVRAAVCGIPTVLVDNGKPVVEAMRRMRVNMNELLELLRSKDYPNLSDVAYAILETNGTLSVIPKPEAKPPTAKDLGTQIPQPQFPITLIVDGKVNQRNLKLAQIPEEKLAQLARAHNILDLRRVILAQVNTMGQVDFHTF